MIAWRTIFHGIISQIINSGSFAFRIKTKQEVCVNVAYNVENASDDANDEVNGCESLGK